MDSNTLVVVGLLLAACLSLIYYTAILIGLYKDSLMADFRRYGEERRSYPLPRFFWSLALLVGLTAPHITITWLAVSLFVLALAAAFTGYLILRVPLLGEALPHWYYRLMQEASRQERRAIAYAWLRLPLRTRLRLNGDRYAFHVFVDEIRLTVIYGARDPDDPWAIWN